MVVGTQDKGHKVSNVQVMPLSLGALPSEEVPRCQTAAYTGGLRGENPRGDINKEQRRASGGSFFFPFFFFLSKAVKISNGDFWRRPLRGILLSERYRCKIMVSINMCYLVALGGGWGEEGCR